ncbi:Aldo/keto reductase [Gonapodya prolifera JEL478]|uniref:Aldo/keto reductase n=1 Tax=Gonapodya prolifera (strain JEL478) TaxID=1344416 RepID=A0A139AIE0_GONPJ|nr:Aldo/keto reductase [Gonapodya prolifera JEL478]|eukprot:KXS16193.1 Aldo/keto reductase [Gonapodya prolifera JEL478]
MPLDPSRYVQLGTVECYRILSGMWQLSSSAWGKYPNQDEIVKSMREYYEAGFTTMDMADHYGPSETLYRRFLQNLAAHPGPSGLPPPRGFTKWVPSPGPMGRKEVERAVRERMERMGVRCLDMIQFHWWDYSDKRYLEALRHFKSLKEEGLIREVALTNFDTQRLKEILDAGIPIVSNQVQFSLVDRRPELRMAELCRATGVKLLTYGTLCGGLISPSYLGQANSPPAPSLTPSQRKYMQMIQTWGGWSKFQGLLKVLDEVAQEKRNQGLEADLSSVAVRWALDKDFVGGVIVGVRFGITSHISSNKAPFHISLTETDRDRIERAAGTGERLLQVIGDCGDEYR